MTKRIGGGTVEPDRQAVLTEMRALAPWHFDIEVIPGLRTTHANAKSYVDESANRVTVIDPQELEPLLQSIFPQGLGGRSFLDVGCNGGGYCFLARRMGADRVVGFDPRLHWIKQAMFLNQFVGDDAVKFVAARLEDLEAEPFHVTLFKGVFYHLPDPIHTLAEICDRTKDLIIIDTATDSTVKETCLVANWESETHVMSGVDGLAWIPGGPAAVRSILKWKGFGQARTVFWKDKWPGGRAHWGRMRLIATRDPVLLAEYDRAQ
jgi:SAM-dependent methyltransferase